MTRRLISVSLVLLWATSLATTAIGQTAAQKQACRPDVWRLCKRFIPRRAAIVSCLAASAPILSPACRVVIMSR